MDDSFDWTILDRHLAGDTSPADRAALDAWRRADPSHNALVKALFAERDRRTGELPEWNVEALRQRIADRTAAGPLGAPTPGDRRPALLLMPRPATPPARTRRWRAAAIAAVAVITVATGGMLVRLKLAARAQPAVALRMQEYRTARGQIAATVLGDGTRVVLAPESVLRVPETIGDSTAGIAFESAREVTLEGGAFFDVVHDERRPFTVRTAAGVARDIGTTFEVRAYEESRSMRVTVVSGVVSLHRVSRRSSSTPGTDGVSPVDTTTLATLTRGDRAILPVAGPVTLTRNVDLGPTVAWTTGSLVFRGMRLDEVVTELSRWYDLDVRLGDGTLAKERLVLTLRNESASATLNLIALSLKLRVERNGRIVTLHRLGERSR